MRTLFTFLIMLFGTQSFASSYTIALQSLTEELAESSVMGVFIGIRLDDGSILNPSFSQEELRSGIATKEVSIEDGRSVANCEYNWLLSQGPKAIVPEGFSEASFASSCALTNGILRIEPIFDVTRFTLEVLPEAMESHNAYFLLLKLLPQDEENYQFAGGELALQSSDLPQIIDFRIISSGKPSFMLLTQWLVTGSAPIEETFDVGEDTQFTLD